MQNEIRGALLTCGYIIIGGSANIILSSYLQQYNQFYLTLLCFGSIQLYLLLTTTTKQLNHALCICSRHWRQSLQLSLFTAVNWLSFYFALSYLEPIVAIAIIHAIGVICDKKMASGNLGYTALYLIPIMGLSGYALLDGITFGRTVALLATFLSGVSIFKTAELSQYFSKLHLTPKQILSFRFILLVVFCAINLLYFSLELHINSIMELAVLIALGYMSVILPNYILQIALDTSSRNNIMLLLSLAPVFIAGLQWGIFSQPPALPILLCVSMISILSLWVCYGKILNFKSQGYHAKH